MLIVAAIAITVVPASVWVTQRVDETYQVSIAQEEAKAKAKRGESRQGKQEQKRAETGEQKLPGPACRWRSAAWFSSLERRSEPDRQRDHAGNKPD